MMSKVVLFIALINSLCATMLGLARLEWPSKATWEAKVPYLIGALIISSFAGTVQVFLSERGEKARRKKLERSDEFRAILMTALVDLVRNCGADWHTTGVRVFKTKTKKWYTLHTHHVRVGLLKLDASAPSGIKWVDGKGIVGQCWETGKKQFGNFDNYGFFDETTWNNSVKGLPKFDLTFKELSVMRDRYGVVAAVPLVDQSTNRYLGCLTMESAPKQKVTPHEAAVHQALALPADLVVRELLK